MADATGEPKLSISDWKIDSLRVTSFPAEPVDCERIAWWEEVIGNKPEERLHRPRQHELIEKGALGERMLTLRIRLDRIDWIFEAPARSQSEAGGFRSGGQFDEGIREIGRLFARWCDLDDCPSSRRLAVGAVLLYPTDDRIGGYRLLSRFLPGVRIDAEYSSDFLYQINRPRPSKSISELRMNRLAKWSVALMKTEMIIFGSHDAPRELGEFHACRIETDMNTDADWKQRFSREEQPRIVDELIGLSEEVVREGDAI